ADGQKLAPSGAPVEWVEEPSYFFRLSAWQKPLLDFYEANPGFVLPLSRRNEVASFVKGGLQDLSVSRTSFRWGVPVPDDPAHIMYVWLDALTNYATAVGYPDFEGNELGRFWPADLHMVGKDILRFHAVYWPAFLMAAGLPLPHTIFAHGWLLFEQDKMSKSRGNIVQPDPIREVLGTDALRYFLLREIPFGQDGNFSFDALLTRYNSDLANDLGNLASRVLTMIGRYFHEEIPYPSPLAQRSHQDLHVVETAERVMTRYCECFDRLEFSTGLEAVWELIAAVNKYLVETEPWSLAEQHNSDDRARVATTLYTAAEALRVTTFLLAPVMPEAAGKIWRQLGLTTDLSSLSLETARSSPLRPVEKIGKVEPVFPRLLKEETLRKL
ncbi:MAG TPA: methionine--tRNA ligase, partial [Candidatus Glassbacteria bacterium]|nr:methionine--tRNA ligase [Candidatus Glassbacteria bacterium]